MNSSKSVLLVCLAAATFSLRAGELPTELQAKFVKMILSSSGASKISCSDASLKAALESQGIQVDSSSMVAWASNASEAKAFKTFGKLVVTGRRDCVSSASILIEEDGGRPKVILNAMNLRGSKVQVSDTILKLGEKI